MKPRNIMTCLVLMLIARGPALGQPVTQDGPVREMERITLTRDTPMDQALRVIQTFSARAVVDPQHLTTPIGVAIDRQPWRRALNMIADHNGLEVVDQENYLELVSMAAARKVGAEATPGPPEVSIDSREVTISAIFFQADRAAMREFGVDWSTLGGGRVDVSASHLGAGQVGSNQFSAGIRANINRSMSVDVLLKTFESQNAGEIIANPLVKVRSGKTGYVQVGSDFSVTTTDFAGNAIAQFFSTGTILTVTPKIITEEGIDYVDLDVSAERSSLIDPVRNLISKTVARTSTLLRDGEQTAVAGLYGQEESKSRGGVPLLKDLPGWFFGLRYLFGNDTRQVSKTELVVLLKVDLEPTVRKRAELHGQAQEPFEIIRQKRKAFERTLEQILKGREPAASSPDTLQQPELPAGE